MKYLLIEDERIASERLQGLIADIRPNYEFFGRADSVKKAEMLLSVSHDIDLIFLDIQLSDGISFEIFDRVNIDVPIIFTTAYDQYAIKAFRLNSIDYLLKPIDPGQLEEALLKFEKFGGSKPSSSYINNFENFLNSFNHNYKERFVIRVGEHLKTVPTEMVNVFFSQDKTTYLQTSDGKRFIIDYSLDKIEAMLDPKAFYRVSRKYIIKLDAIGDIISFSNSRLKLVINQFAEDDVIVARERVSEFKSWLDR
ncbi:MAG: response regulator transcription factor [Cyclobacteriaceae bacterium]|nr:response regulator transcription factor [Cyclobacteriaceae bacterium HetDA_MAG_MS6]